MNLYNEQVICGKKGSWFNVEKYKLKSLPEKFHCTGSLNCDGSLLKELPSNMIIDGDLYIGDCEIAQLPSKLVIGGDLILLNSSIFDLPNDICICGNIIAIKANNVPNYCRNTVYNNFICDQNGKIVPFEYSKFIKREMEEDNFVHRAKSCTFYKGLFGQDILTYDSPTVIISCKGIKDGILKMDKKLLKESPIYYKYYNYDVNQKRFVAELMVIFQEVTDACQKGIQEFIEKEKIVMTNKYSIKELDLMLKNSSYGSFYTLFDDYFFHREKFD